MFELLDRDIKLWEDDQEKCDKKRYSIRFVMQI